MKATYTVFTQWSANSNRISIWETVLILVQVKWGEGKRYGPKKEKEGEREREMTEIGREKGLTERGNEGA